MISSLAGAKSLSSAMMGSRRLFSISSTNLQRSFDDEDSNADRSSVSSQVRGSEPRRRAFGLNRVELIGNLGNDPRVNTSKNGTDWCSFPLFTNATFRRKDGTIDTQTQVHDVTAFGYLADNVKNNIRKGARVFVLGSISYYEKEVGETKVKVASINADRVLPIAKSTGGQQSNDFD
ncbi:single-strand binding protein family domain-containing protein [Ditylenchus destructor]|nr:single-strand binding protein family domain-containing protein [Ditylenchus destructor]